MVEQLEQEMSAAIIPSDGGDVLDVVGDRVRILVDSEMSGGECMMFECITQPGNGPPMHKHNIDTEVWHVIEGTVKFSVDGVETVVTAGGTVYGPRGTTHTFVNVGDAPSRMLISCYPGGLEVPFREADAMKKDGSMTMEKLTAAFEKFDLEFLGPPLQK